MSFLRRLWEPIIIFFWSHIRWLLLQYPPRVAEEVCWDAVRPSSPNSETLSEGSDISEFEPPVHTLPDDVLIEIFSLCIDKGFRSPYEQRRPVLLDIGEVCFAWRVLSLGTSSLWSHISIAGPSKRDLLMVPLWLQRSGAHPLSIYMLQSSASTIRLDMGLQARSNILRRTERVFNMLVSDLLRWRHVRFRFNWDVVPSALIQLQPGIAVPSLETVDVDFPDGYTVETDRFWRRVHSYASLSAVNWNRIYHAFVPVHLPLQGLKNITAEFDTSEHALALLAECPSLTDFRAVIRYHADSERFDVVHLPELQYLDIDFMTTMQGVRRLLDHVRAPKLTSLQLSCEHLTDEGDAIQHLLDRSHCQLKSFAFRYSGSYGPLYDELLLSHIPLTCDSLVELMLDVRSADAVTRKLTIVPLEAPTRRLWTPRHQLPTYLPSLRKLELVVETVREELVFQLLASRPRVRLTRFSSSGRAPSTAGRTRRHR